jgi:hypothetical protein
MMHFLLHISSVAVHYMVFSMEQVSAVEALFFILCSILETLHGVVLDIIFPSRFLIKLHWPILRRHLFLSDFICTLISQIDP